MDHGILLVILYNEERLIKGVSLGDGIDWLKLLICAKWKQLVDVAFRTLYTVGKHTNCLLIDESDFASMIMICKVLGEACVDVVVRVDNEKDKPQPGIGDCSNVRKTPTFNQVGSSSNGGGVSVVDECFSFYESLDDGLLGLSSSPPNNIANVPLFRPPAYEMCPDIVAQPLLSKGWELIIEGVGQIFRGGRIEFREQLAKYATKLGFDYTIGKNNTRYVNVSCKGKEEYDCKWHIRGTQTSLSGEFVIKKALLIHTCIGNLLTNPTKRIGPKMWSTMVLETVRKRPTHPGREMMDYIKLSYGWDVPYYKARRSIDVARGSIYGTFQKSFDQLRWYCEALVETNPGSVAFVMKDPVTKRFTNAFFSFQACLQGFKSCRPILFIDATFMHGRTQASIFSAIAKDGNNGLFPVAFAITTGETLANWTWFLQEIKNIVKHDLEICYVSDRNAGLLSAFTAVWGSATNNFYCLYHLRTNLKAWYSGSWGTEHREKMCALLTDCAYAPNIRVFDERVEIFCRSGGPLARSFLDTIPYDKWAVAYAPNVMRYGEMTSNAAESFNNWILVARSLPVTFMVDTIRRDVMRWFVERRADANSWSSLLCTNRQDLWNHHVELSRTWMVNEAPNGKFEVLSKVSAEVDLELRSCTCSQWQIHGFPCPHAAAVILKKCSRITEAVEPYFFALNYKKCYSGNINPVPDTARFECKALLDDESVLPPIKKNQPGRPAKKRKKSYGEVPRKKPTACPSCGLISRHDPLTCLIQV